MAAFALRGLTCAIIACLLLLAPTSEAVIACGTVISALGSCIPYVLGRAPLPGPLCCGGVQNLYHSAATPTDRRAVCGCLKTFSGALSGVNYGRVALVPKQCGVNLPYTVSPSTDCNKIP